ncbi:hypothetical protein VNI00_003152 [Paramarasmius palmivorus]|uniref:Major facilitator superfamily (MFS) profile domain-containing protein n=1 Tax=Paramarasmius palmivorus TaxID=297713 RepID=A0AAW0DT43_9AGAR
MVYFYAEKLPGNYWFLVFGPLIEGSLGGFTSIMAAIQAYMADTSTPATRSRVFSLAMGLMFTGFAVGPTLGGILIRFTHQVISVFYVAAFSHLFYALMTWLVLPESLTKRKMELSTIKYRQQLDGTSEHTATGIITIFRRLFFFLSPLTVFLPLRVGEVKVFGRNWNLTLIALGYAFTISIMGSYTYKFQYAASEFGWSSETISYWLSLVGGARAFHLAVILPICIRLFKGKPRRPLATSSEEQEPLIHEATETQTTPTPRSTSHSPSRLTEPHSSHFDLNLARVSLFIEIIAYTCMGLATHPIAFTVFGMMGSLGTGFAPAIQSVALDLYTRGGEETETGKLFGAMSVVQALSSQILGPAMYGLIYMNTVATYPRTIFFVSVASVLISFIILAFVRLPAGTKPGTLSDVEEQLLPEGSTAREDTLVDAEDH